MTISLCMIVKNEQLVLEKCLDSIKDVVDEIIIVDTGSNDLTINIAKKYTHKIFQLKWIDDFSYARNYSISKATKDYILWLDADDYLDVSQLNKLKKLKLSIDGSIDMYYLLYNFNDDYEPFYRERIFKNNGKFKFIGKVHEVIIPSGKIKYETITIRQTIKEVKDNSRNLKIYEKMDINTFSTRDYYYFGKELYRNNKINQSLKILKKAIKQNDIYIEDAIDSYFTIASIYKLKKDYRKSLDYLFKTFLIDLPRNNILCEIGNIYYQLNYIEKAIYYYQLALKTKNNNKTFILKDYLGFYPAMMLCLCYDKLKLYDKANDYNELANTFKKDTLCYKNNKNYFESLLK